MSTTALTPVQPDQTPSGTETDAPTCTTGTCSCTPQTCTADNCCGDGACPAATADPGSVLDAEAAAEAGGPAGTAALVGCALGTASLTGTWLG